MSELLDFSWMANRPLEQLFRQCNEAGCELVLGTNYPLPVYSRARVGEQVLAFMRPAAVDELEASRAATLATKPSTQKFYYVVVTD